MKYVLILTLLLWSSAYARDPHHDHDGAVTNVTNVTELTERYVTEEFNTYDTYNILDRYTFDECQGVALGQAGANNNISMATNKPQLSLGVGVCGGEFAGSVMFGVKIRKNILVNGSLAADEDVEAGGAGMTILFQ